MAENLKIYDVTFKRMFRVSNRLLIKFVNKVFEKDFPLDTTVRFLDPNTENESNEVREKDLYFEIQNERFQLEAQSYWDDMIFRLFEYAVDASKDNYQKVDAEHAVFKMPKQAVIFLKGVNKNKNRLHIKLILPDEKEVEYEVPAIRALGYTPQTLVENDMEILLPFQIIRMWNKVKDYEKYSQQDKDRFLSDFSRMCEDIVVTMDKLLEREGITNDEYRHMLHILQDLERYLYSDIEDIKKKGVDLMVEEKIVLSEDRIYAEAKNEVAENMIIDKEPVEKIKKYTGLSLDALYELSKKLGISLVL